MKKNKGFTLVEIIIVIVILASVAGLFAVNMIKTLNQNKEEETNNVVTTIKSAASAYVSSNPEALNNLYNGYGYVDLKVGDLRDAGLVSEDLTNPQTGERISDDEIVRVTLENGDLNSFKYPVEESERNLTAWSLKAENLYIEYDKNTTKDIWCASESNIFAGLDDKSANYMKNVKSKLYLLDNSNAGERYKGDYINGAKLSVTSCNVNPQMAGTYQIEYKFTDPTLNIEKTAIRNVFVQASGEDVVTFTAVINNGRDVVKGVQSAKITITETYKNSETSNTTVLDTTTDKLSDIGYTIENFVTSNTGNYTATILSNKTNSDGSRPASVKASYKVTDSLIDLINDSKKCTVTSGSICYFRGNQDENYISYNGANYRIVSKDGTSIKLIYDGNDIVAPYGQLGQCESTSCCNGGRYIYAHLGGTKGTGMVDTMDTVLSNFSSTRIDTNPSYRQSFNTPYGVRKISLLTRAEYNEISSCSGCKSNYLTGQKFWLVDASASNKGAGTYNRGTNASKAYTYAVNESGSVYEDGSYKDSTSNLYSDFYMSNVHTSKLVVKPVIQLGNPKIISGDGTKTSPYVVG